MADDPSVYGSYMNFFLPPSARVGTSGASTPGLFDMLGGMGLGGWGGTPGATGAPADQQKKQQQQQMALAQQGLKMMQPQQMPVASPRMPDVQDASYAVPQMPPPPASQVPQGTQPGGYSQPGGYPRRSALPPMMPRSPFGNY